jgi:hypothetical protein
MNNDALTSKPRRVIKEDVQCKKFNVCQRIFRKGSQDIDWSVYSYVQFDP